MSPSQPPGDTPLPNTFTADYPNLFGDQGVDRCPDDALESSFGPFAYAKSLFVIVRRLEATLDAPPVSPLARRRPDIESLLLDEPALNRRVPKLHLAVEYLEAMVESHQKGDAKAAALIAEATSPAGLPFDRAWALITQVLRRKRQHPWQLLRQTDEDYPNFSHRTVISTSMRSALTLCTGLAPAQMKMLQQAPAADDTALWQRLGMPSATTIDGLADSATFLKATGLNRKRLRQLLAVNGVATDDDKGTYSSVTVSTAGMPAGQPDSSAFAARFVNGGRTPALRLVAGGEHGKAARIENLSTAHLQRMDTMLRLHTGIGLSFAALDRLLQAAFAAQRSENDFRIDAHVLRVLGLYVHLRDSRRVNLDAFAALIHEIAPYATGRETSYYDTIFRPGAGSGDLVGQEPPLTMDGGTFVNATSDPTVQRLCAGLGVSPDTLTVFLAWILKARDTAPLARNLSILSACHRLAVLPRWLGHSEKDGLALLRLFEQTRPELFALLAGLPLLSKGATNDQPDIVDAVVTLINLSDWLGKHRLDAQTLGAVLLPEDMSAIDLARSLSDISTRKHTATDNGLREALLDMPFAGEARPPPTAALASLLEPTGLFKNHVFDMDSDTLEMEIEFALDPLKDATPGVLAENAVKFERTKLRVGQRLGEWLEGQRSVLTSVLEALLPGTPDASLRQAVANWVGATPTAILGLLGNRRSLDENSVAWVRTLRQRARLVSWLSIDVPTIEAIRSHREWFDMSDTDVQNPGLVALHRLTEWNGAVRDVATRAGIEVDQACQQLLAYLHTASDTSLGAPDVRLANLLRVDRTVVTSVAARASGTTPGGAPTTATHIAWLLRLHALAERSTTSVEALLALADLEPQSDAANVATAGHLLLATCTPAERETIVGMHNQAWRDAMIAWLLPRATNVDGKPFVGRNELSAWLLTDLEVGPEPETTRLAAAMDSLQLYIHRLLSGLEKHLRPNADIKEERKQWSAYRSRYVDWRHYRERREYPENYIHPANRQRKTSAFLDMETQLAQGQARPTDIDTTLLQYLADFERTSNIQVISAYHDGVDPTRDELHLIGRSNIEPYEYFWRSAKMDVKAADGHTGMLAWSDWSKIDLPINGELTRTRIPSSSAPGNDDSRTAIETIRPLTIDGRKYVVWAERDSSAVVFDKETAASDYYALRMCYSYLDTNNNWSASNTLLSLDGIQPDGTRPKTPPALKAGEEKPNNTLFTRGFMPGLIVMENRKGKREADPYLVAMLFDSEWKPGTPDKKISSEAGESYFLAIRDLLLIDEKRLDGADPARPLEKRLVDNWFRLYGDPRVVQHPYIGAKYVLQAPKADKITKATAPDLAAWHKSLFVGKIGEVTLAADLTSDGSEIVVTGEFDGEWSESGAPRPFASVDDIDHVLIRHKIRLMTLSGGLGSGWLLPSYVDYFFEAHIKAKDWNQSAVSFRTVRIASDKLPAILAQPTGTVYGSRLRYDVSHAQAKYETSEINYTNSDDLALAALELCLGNFDRATLTFTRAFPSLAELLEQEKRELIVSSDVGRSPEEGNIDNALMRRSHDECTFAPSGASYQLGHGPNSIAFPYLLISSTRRDDAKLPLKAQLIRVAKSRESRPAAADAGLRDALKAIPSTQQAGSANPDVLYALATSKTEGDSAALDAWLPLLTDTWRIPAGDYYDALRNEDLELGTPDKSALQGSLPFLQAMHATNRESLREALIGIVARTLGDSLPAATRERVPAAVRTQLVRLAAEEQARYRDLMIRLAKLAGGSEGDTILKEQELDAHASGSKRFGVTLPVDVDETDYTFRLVLSSADDPGSSKASAFKERIRLEAPYTLTNATGQSTDTPDDRVPSALIRRNQAQAQYLDLDESRLPPIRLNTLFGKQLVARATRSVDAALSIDAQTLPEPALRTGGSGGFVDFRGANGLSFWELFFHVPWLVAWSLREKGRYDEAWRWCSRYLFDPYRGRTTETTAPIPFWNCLPLVYPLDGARDTGEAPELAGYANAIHFRKAIHAFLVDLWRMQGDEQFRRISPDSLREANLSYQKALQLIGTLQEPAEAKPWAPTLLGARKPSFVQPVNRVLRDRRDVLLARLDNLRHGRTIDGVLIPYLGYGDEDTDGGSGGGRRGTIGGLRALALHTMPAYRFREVAAMAAAAVERLTDMGRYLFHIYEQEADNALEVERQKNLLALADFDISLRRKAVETARRERNTLQLSHRAVEDRVAYYAGQLESPRSKREEAASKLAADVAGMHRTRLLPIVGAGASKVAPTIFGMAIGGSRFEGVTEALDQSLAAGAEAWTLLLEDMRTQAEYDRRNEAWTYEKRQAEHDLGILASQLDEQTSRAESATIELNEAIKRRDYLRSEFQIQTTGFAVASTYTWMLGRLGELFASAYQSVFTLCMDAEASYRYETGDFDSRHVRLDAWNGAQRGMFAGEALQSDLQAMQTAYLRRHVRRLRIHKTISLKALLGDAALKGNKIAFDLDASVFDADFPGQYLRQIRHVAVVLVPAANAKVLTADTEIRAVLTQSSNTLLYRPDPEAAEWLYDPAKGSPEAILRDVRGNQQAVISHASPRPSADPMETIMLRTDFQDGRYRDFEGTGAISSWTLTFPGGGLDKVVRSDIADIELRLDYTAAWGGTEFKEKADSLCKSAVAAKAAKASAATVPGGGKDATPPTKVPRDALMYPTPVVPEVRGRNALDRRDAAHGATVTVAPWPSIRAGQQLWLRCLGTRADGTSLNRALRGPSAPVTVGEITQGIEATIPFEYLEALGDYAQVKIQCKVSLDGSGASATATAFPELALDIPKCVTLSLAMAATHDEWVPHTSPRTPWILTHAGYVTLTSEEGPTNLAYLPSAPTPIGAMIVARGSGTEHVLHLKARRLSQGTASYGMNNFVPAGRMTDYVGDTFLRIRCLATDNPELPAGTYDGKLVLQLFGKQVPRVLESIFVDIAVSIAPPPPEPAQA